ncbi:hypothetical protein [Henriciella marina]|uniref:hypothetical protein n=1 Tax=Henriciella marina TaxID=453851 RepID=UPI000376F996|nr:hypothetical protein [Henriciella marina]
MFKRPRLSAQSFPVNAGIAGFLLFYAASCSGPQEPAEQGSTAPQGQEDVVSADPLPANMLPAVWSTRQLDSPVASIGIAGGAGSTFAVAYEGGGVQIFDFDGERVTTVAPDEAMALAEGRYAMLSGTPVTLFPGLDANGSLKVWIHGGGVAEAIQYDLQGEQAGAAAGICAGPPANSDDDLHRLAYWTETDPGTLYSGVIRQSGGELVFVTEAEEDMGEPITSCVITGNEALAFSGNVDGAASLRRNGRETLILSEGDGQLSLQLGDNEPARYEIRRGISVEVPAIFSTLAATGDARGGGYPGGVIIVSGTIRGDDHRVVMIDPSRVTMTPIEVPSATE